MGKKISDLRSKDDVRGVVSSNEKTFVLMEDNQTPIFHNLYKLFSNFCNDLIKRSFWNLGISSKIVNASSYFLYASLIIEKCGDIDKNPGLEFIYESFPQLSVK